MASFCLHSSMPMLSFTSRLQTLRHLHASTWRLQHRRSLLAQITCCVSLSGQCSILTGINTLCRAVCSQTLSCADLTQFCFPYVVCVTSPMSYKSIRLHSPDCCFNFAAVLTLPSDHQCLVLLPFLQVLVSKRFARWPFLQHWMEQPAGSCKQFWMQISSAWKCCNWQKETAGETALSRYCLLKSGLNNATSRWSSLTCVLRASRLAPLQCYNLA